jgi:hypothetical protein
MTRTMGIRRDITVDLRWSLWSANKGTWDDDEPGAWDYIKGQALRGNCVVVNTAPWKEIRFGTVDIRHAQRDGFVAWATFRSEWDDGTSDVVGECEVWAKTFRSLMYQIDQLEVELIGMRLEDSNATDPS